MEGRGDRRAHRRLERPQRDRPLRRARRGGHAPDGLRIEAAAIYRHEDHHHLFVNWGHCCRGVHSTCNIRVGRSREFTGPYVGKEGVDLLQGVGSLVLATEERYVGPRHAGILEEGERSWSSFHFYDGEGRGRPQLAIRLLESSSDGWPVVKGPPKTPAAKE